MADCQMCGANHPDGGTRCPDERTGQMIGTKYRIGALLGVGGIAAVYAAEHPVLRREIAVKILHRRYARDAELGARFVREARETAALGHPAFVRVHDAGTTDDGCAFIEMDRLEGRDLYSLRTEQGPLPHERVVNIAIDVLDALSVLHARGVIHRDLKSSNIYVVPSDGTGEKIKLLDLGFAKVEDDLALTNKDQLLGTPFYISPEQYNDPTAVDARADLFSLGIVMFEALVGDWPYAWSNKRDLLGKVMRGDLERHPATRRADVPDWVDAIVAKALAHARDDRFASALEMKDALAAGAPPERPSLLKRLFG
ncbi:MAG TPA: serine/threonine-protein kinase [Kofleriaceae bacterium]|jgi:serine/threonine-protein kinase|nr:serine/threonine-protein kinase [Kofleriaceae bacterium]